MDPEQIVHAGHRAMQDRAEGRRVPDRIAEIAALDAFTDEYRAFVERQSFFFLATAAFGQVDCSFKGGPPGFVQVTGPDRLVFPDYDGNRMYRSLGNILESPAVGLLFVSFGREEGAGALYLRLRVNGEARVVEGPDAAARWTGALRMVEVRVRQIFPNCPRYVPELAEVAPSRHLPGPDGAQPMPAGKTLPPIAEVL